jgi:1-acyl-sn-glycerol-3-phosphate acyltransferase
MSRQSKGRILRWLHGDRGVPWGSDPNELDVEAVMGTLATVGELFGEEGWPRRYFPLEIEGLRRLPEPPVMIVSNHSGGTTIPDVWGFLVAWYRRFGAARPIHPLAHEMILSTRFTGPYFAKRGVLRATRNLAHRALVEQRRDIMVMPGGDLDTWRPFRKRYQVDFGGRNGYARLAIETGVPIVPVAHSGAHETLLVLSDGRWLAKVFHLRELARSSVWPIHLSLPWGLGFGPLPHLPLPARMRYRVGAPILPPPLRPGEEIDAQRVAMLDDEVRAAIQAMLDDLRETRAPLGQALAYA